MPRFIPVISGNGLTAVKDTLHSRLVCAFFIDKARADAVLVMVKICCEALNVADKKRTAPTIMQRSFEDAS